MAGEEGKIKKSGLEEMRTRLIAAQPRLESILSGALDLYDSAVAALLEELEQGRTPTRLPNFTHKRALNEPVYCGPGLFCGTLSVDLAASPEKAHISVDRTHDGAPNAYPRKRVICWGPKDDEGASTKVDIFWTHDPDRSEYPYDINAARYGTTMSCIGLVVTDYSEGQVDPCLDMVRGALQAASSIVEQA